MGFLIYLIFYLAIRAAVFIWLQLSPENRLFYSELRKTLWIPGWGELASGVLISAYLSEKFGLSLQTEQLILMLHLFGVIGLLTFLVGSQQ